MSIDIGAAYDHMVAIVMSAPTVTAGMDALLDYCAQIFPSPVWKDLRSLDYAADVASLQGWLERLLTQEPPASSIVTFWFGLYESTTEDGPEYVLYLSGSTEDYTPESLDWACWTNDTYLPEDRYVHHSALTTLFRTVHSEQEAQLLAEYALCLGYSSLAISWLMKALPPHLILGEAEQRTVVTGFDDGDNVLLGQMDKRGWHPALSPSPLPQAGEGCL